MNKFKNDKYYSTFYGKPIIYLNGWNFVATDTNSEARELMEKAVRELNGTEYRLTIKGIQNGFEWR